PNKSNLSLAEAKVKIGDRSYLGKTVTLSGLNNTELKLVALASMAPLKIAQQKLAIGVILLSFLGVAIAFVVGYGVSDLIATRIARVTNAIEKIAGGELKTEVPVTHNDEIDKLAMGFNLMAEQLKERDRTITYQMHKLEETLQQLARSIELIQSEKMSSLGQMVAGIAHEFNNPVSFIYGNVDPAIQYVDDLLEVIKIYQQEAPNPTPLVEETVSDLELDFVAEDLQSLLKSMKNGATRIRDIVEKLKTFSRLEQAGMRKVEIHENIDSTLSLLRHRLYPIGAEGELIRKEIEVVKDFEDLPPVICSPAQLNQVFFSIINNAIDALEEAIANNQISQNPQIKITTEVADLGWIKIIIADNGPGMTEGVRKQVFNPFFTTKPPGSGTGLGLSVSYSIVVEHHQGRLSCISAPGEGSEFIIEIPNN
ncbi:MAG: HAMP domain-containing histidine kinase, partial [Okeania sp. SIO2H7]|nr:HAMP domain-containing histidine kinase [Okeania sp. SIO2H7]